MKELVCSTFVLLGLTTASEKTSHNPVASVAAAGVALADDVSVMVGDTIRGACEGGRCRIRSSTGGGSVSVRIATRRTPRMLRRRLFRRRR